MNESNFYIVRPFLINDSTFISSNVDEDDYAEWDSGTTYSTLGQRVIIIDTDIHRIYESINNSGNLNKNPLTEPTFWVFVSATNRWKMFDNSNTSQTVNLEEINVTVSTVSRPNAIFLGNVECEIIQIIQRDPMDNIVLDNTYPMIESTGSPPSYYNWHFAQLQRKEDLFVAELLPYSGGTVQVILSNSTGLDAKCATMLVGYADAVGLTQLGFSLGIQDFSVKQTNEFGDSEILERPFSREGEFNVFIENSGLSRLFNLLSSRRATATLYVGTSGIESSFIYGFYDDFNIITDYNETSFLNIQIKGLS